MKNQALLPTLRLSLEVTDVLADIERNGIKINRTTLADIRKEYEDELFTLERRLQELAANAMGDTPVNLDSPDDRSRLFYSCAIKDKKRWAAIFNLGHEVRGATKKPKQRTRMAKGEFKRHILNETTILHKTIGEQCPDCSGKGRYTPPRKDGTPGKAVRICKTCGGSGVRYHNTGEVAGFKLVPRDTFDTAAGGFKTDKATLEEMMTDLRGEAREFAEAYVRYSAVRTYLRSFVEGMENNMDPNGFIHTEYMQCVTATGRLSSRNPNFQNMPRGSTFIIRRAVESRFEGGSILEGDYAQLEFRVAGFLAKDEGIRNDVEAGTDVHNYTASIIGCTRQEAKAHTFKPLYGGVSGTEDQKRYYRAFKQKYSGVSDWHELLQRDAVIKSHIKLPSGRQYCFPGTRWTEWGTATNRTAICNYPVQGFATADLLPLSLVMLHNLLKDSGLQSVICNTVHDSIVMDVFPGEEKQCIEIMAKSMLAIPQETERRYGIRYDMPVGIELKMGKNWLDLEEVLTV
jgi:DNA polymerase I-like protein with 3'-5' exonuclease and polymerase domains